MLVQRLRVEWPSSSRAFGVLARSDGDRAGQTRGENNLAKGMESARIEI